MSSTCKFCSFQKVVHDAVIQKLPVRLILDRAGLVGNDGPTHHGSFDLTYLGTLPNIVIMAPSDEIELMNMVEVRVVPMKRVGELGGGEFSFLEGAFLFAGGALFLIRVESRVLFLSGLFLIRVKGRSSLEEWGEAFLIL